ncbi:ABC transporter ATP-binding protein [Ferrimicrobium acidiphilum]|uniref:ABC transporter ATP-binding protein n=2 Tax=Ferrimicrobium acidiphilum TaxID=121039 RepID=UPI0023F360BE|nr:ABC transporter ATP-binding protein [Ferrimicrobium acidiphilum]
MMDQVAPILSVVALEKSFGGVQAVRGAEFDVQEGSITALIGPNGAGKSTVVNLIAGALHPDAGHVHFQGAEITGRKPFQVARHGLIRTFQISREYPALTVLENLMVSPLNQTGEHLLTALFRRGRYKQEERDLVEKAVQILDDFGLYAMRDEYARNLSGGQKRLLELARAVMADPKMLILDEPMAGINPALISRIGEHMLRLKEESGYTFLMVEHNLDVVERICDHVVVLAVGRTLARGTMAELRMDTEVVSAYLTGGTVGASTKG